MDRSERRKRLDAAHEKWSRRLLYANALGPVLIALALEHFAPGLIYHTLGAELSLMMLIGASVAFALAKDRLAGWIVSRTSDGR